MVNSIIRKSQLEGAQRLDAEYYQPEYLRVRELMLSNCSCKSLDKVIIKPVVTGSTPQKRDCREDGSDIKFIKTDVVRDGEINFGLADCLPKAASRKTSEPTNGDLLVTIIGATYDIVGRTARIFENDPKMNINQNIVLIRPFNIVLSGYLESFFRSKFGRMQLWQQSRQTEQVNLNCREVENVLVALPPMPFQKEIDDLVTTARNLRLSSLEIYQQAENFLLKELGFTDFQNSEDLAFEVNFSEVKNASRIDADYFQPKYEKIIEKIRKQSAKSIEELSELVGHAMQSPYDEIGNIAVVAQNHMKGNLEVDTSLFDNFTSENLIKGSDKKFILKKGDVLISSTGKPGLTCVWFNEYDKRVIPGSFVTLVRFNNVIDPLYAGVFLNTIAGRLQFEKDYTGSVQQYVYPVKIKEIMMPILPKDFQQKIADLVQKSHEARRKSKELLEEAKRKVEVMIEKGGEGN